MVQAYHTRIKTSFAQSLTTKKTMDYFMHILHLSLRNRLYAAQSCESLEKSCVCCFHELSEFRSCWCICSQLVWYRLVRTWVTWFSSTNHNHIFFAGLAICSVVSAPLLPANLEKIVKWFGIEHADMVFGSFGFSPEMFNYILISW